MCYRQSFNQAAKSITKWQIIFAVVALLCTLNNTAMAQPIKHMLRLAKIKVDSVQLKSYNTALKEQMAAAIRIESGVLTYYAVADKNDPTSITIFEVYASRAAYELHIQTPHFKKYKATVKDMVKALELTDVTLIGSASKRNN